MMMKDRLHTDIEEEKLTLQIKNSFTKKENH